MVTTITRMPNLFSSDTLLTVVGALSRAIEALGYNGLATTHRSQTQFTAVHRVRSTETEDFLSRWLHSAPPEGLQLGVGVLERFDELRSPTMQKVWVFGRKGPGLEPASGPKAANVLIQENAARVAGRNASNLRN